MTQETKRKNEEPERTAAEERRKQEKELDKALQDSFPASDPISSVQPTPGPEEDDKPKEKPRRAASSA